MGALEGKAALVTGASGGIGQAVVRTFEQAGATVFGVDLVPSEGVFQADLGRADEAEAAVDAAVSELGRLDVVFNGAGISGRPFGDGAVHECAEEAWDRYRANAVWGVVMWLVTPHGVHTDEVQDVSLERCLIAAEELDSLTTLGA